MEHFPDLFLLKNRVLLSFFIKKVSKNIKSDFSLKSMS